MPYDDAAYGASCGDRVRQTAYREQCGGVKGTAV
jgi:hypothetical protein